MRSSFGLFVMIVFFVLVARSVSSAQEGAPAGSYQQTCHEISVKKEALYAKCQDERGKYHSAKLSDYARCNGDITNKNGNLECTAQEGSSSPNLPVGPYTDNCKDIHMKGSTLHAVCKSINGREMTTILRDAHLGSEGGVNE